MAGESEPPEAWGPALRFKERLREPVERFLRIQSASGVLLVLAAAAALIWANSGAAETYFAIVEGDLSVSIGPLHASAPLQIWVDDGLMVLFFFVVGLEIRRELHEGELSELRRAALPLAAALGGMAAPAAIYLLVAEGGPHASGWGVPMATDIAFALAALSLLGSRVPPALRVLLLALAVIDDIGATLVIALFYSSDVAVTGLLLALAGVLAVLAMQRMGVRSVLAYLLPGAAVWLGMHEGGIHPTLAGAAMGLLTPPRTWLDPEEVVEGANHALSDFVEASRANERSWGLEALARIEWLRREAVSPVDRLLRATSGWAAFVVMPIFAFANAGVTLHGAHAHLTHPVVLGTSLGLLVGKPLGIFVGAWLAVKLRFAELPRGVTWPGVLVVGLVGGVGFTVSIFVASLAHEGEAMTLAKLAVVGASCAAAVIALLVGRLALSPDPAPGAAKSAGEAERSTSS